MEPLAGKKVLVTRGKSQASTFSDRIEEEGGVAVLTPLLTFQLNDTKENHHILTRLHDYSWVFLTSSNGVKFFFDLMKRKGVPVPVTLRFAIIGKKTEQMLRSFGYEADFMPTAFDAKTMGKEFFKDRYEEGPVLYVRGNRSKDVLPQIFEEKQVFFQSITVYDTLLVKDDQRKLLDMLKREELDALTFTSPSTIQAYMALVKGTQANGKGLPCFCIGPTTAEKAERSGFKKVMTPEQYTIDHMVERMIQYFCEEGKR
ncbi:uroporphyrinogen-III synthase [Halobacillus sp. BBL2006]|uniref:uroporphyrinogen-III synthase n=1 Tax=Halobacillus sp. BBL2006 TaxID=1543706 RepID=UPI0005430A8C|nr:uroporphyrinogen-III synthase [Halobacillus sp. BBL2006]KHE72990.1 uroporphyrinogen-III synthase [Halobacillus sp. BBL2006]